MFSLILILYKLDNFNICPLDESVMRRLKLDITFATLGPIGIWDIGNFVGITLYFLAIFLFILMFILIFMNMF